MSRRKLDPLLAVARLLLAVAMAIALIVIGAVAVALPAVLIRRDDVLAQLAVQGAPDQALLALCALLVLVALGAVLSLFFFRNLFRIVGSVGEGDPFVPANARRLSQMGWIVVAVHALIIPMTGIARWIDTVSEHVHSDAAISVSGLLLAIVLFVLARVFRQGTRMREELEGTV